MTWVAAGLSFHFMQQEMLAGSSDGAHPYNTNDFRWTPIKALGTKKPKAPRGEYSFLIIAVLFPLIHYHYKAEQLPGE